MNWFVLIVFVLLPLLGAGLAARSWALVRRGVRVKATVVGFEQAVLGASSDSVTVNLPKVEFADQAGRRVQLTLPQEAPDNAACSQGSSIRLIYPLGNPRRARYDNRVTLWLVPAMCFGPALTFITWLAASIAWHWMIE